ncbi:MAG: hypothetical protein H3C49_11715 [Alphaproteobacteria bacterium]|nr:hypothetical protein [Alphaproteobacteria bacterium]
MTKEDFQKSATNRGKTDTTGQQGRGAIVIKLQHKASHFSTPRPPMPKSPFGHIMPVAINLKALASSTLASKDETEKESKKDEK